MVKWEVKFRWWEVQIKSKQLVLVTGFQEDLLVNLEVTKWFKHSYREMEVQERPYLLAHLTRLVSKMKAFIVEA